MTGQKIPVHLGESPKTPESEANVTVASAAIMRGYNPRHLRALCAENKILGAVQRFGMWFVPFAWAIDEANDNPGQGRPAKK